MKLRHMRTVKTNTIAVGITKKNQSSLSICQAIRCMDITLKKNEEMSIILQGIQLKCRLVVPTIAELLRMIAVKNKGHVII